MFGLESVCDRACLCAICCRLQMPFWVTRCSPTMIALTWPNCVRKQASCRERWSITLTCMILNEQWCIHTFSTQRYDTDREYKIAVVVCGDFLCVADDFLFISSVVGEFLWLPVCGGFLGVSEGHVICQHPAEPADLRAGRLQVPRAAHYSIPH